MTSPKDNMSSAKRILSSVKSNLTPINTNLPSVKSNMSSIKSKRYPSKATRHLTRGTYQTDAIGNPSKATDYQSNAKGLLSKVKDQRVKRDSGVNGKRSLQSQLSNMSYVKNKTSSVTRKTSTVKTTMSSVQAGSGHERCPRPTMKQFEGSGRNVSRGPRRKTMGIEGTSI